MSHGPTLRETVLTLLVRRAAGATICPSEVAKAIAIAAGTGNWRAEMPRVHFEVEHMVTDGLVRLTWKGADRNVGEGPYRINLCHAEQTLPTEP